MWRVWRDILRHCDFSRVWKLINEWNMASNDRWHTLFWMNTVKSCKTIVSQPSFSPFQVKLQRNVTFPSWSSIWLENKEAHPTFSPYSGSSSYLLDSICTAQTRPNQHLYTTANIYMKPHGFNVLEGSFGPWNSRNSKSFSLHMA